MVLYGKALFIHVPKTGGSWVRSVLEDNGGKRISYPHDLPQNHFWKIRIRRLAPFCFVRHPLMLVYSLWKHWTGDEICRINNSNKDLYGQWDKAKYGQVFCELIVEGDINKTLTNFTHLQPGLVSSMYEIFTDHCKYVGRYERITEDLKEFLYSINGNVSPRLLADINSKKMVNVSLGDDAVVYRDVAEQFMANEPACELYGYSYFPEVVEGHE